MSEKRSSRKTGSKPKFKCDHCKLPDDALSCDLYACNNTGTGCSKFCCQACAFHMDKSTGAPDEVPSNADIVCSSCASAEQKANWWLLNPLKGNAKGNAKQPTKKRQKSAGVQQSKDATANNVAKLKVSLR